jgi:PhnB protein
MRLNPYLTFNGNCAAAFKFYERCLGGKIEMMMSHGDSPMAAQTPSGWRDKIMHARLTLGELVVMGSDARPRCTRSPRDFRYRLV